MNAILEMRGISKTFPGVKALDNVNITVKAGEIHALVGENGAGKSTLMKVLSGVYPHGSYSGSIVYEGTERRFKGIRSEEHTSELQSRQYLVCRLLLEKKKKSLYSTGEVEAGVEG